MSGQRCFHCGDVCDRHAVQQSINGEPLWFCCRGCSAVAQMIAGSDLAPVYQNRTAFQPSMAGAGERDFIWYQETAAEAHYTAVNDQHREADLLIEGLSCGACVWLCEQSLQRLDGVEKAAIRFEANRLFVRYSYENTDLATICAAIESLGYRLKPFDQQQQEQYFKQSQHSLLTRIGVSGLGMMLVGMLALAMHFGEQNIGGVLPLHIGNYMLLASTVVSGFVISFCGWPFFSGSLKALKQGGISMDITISLALLLAWGLSFSHIVTALVSDAGLVYAEQTTYFESLLMLLFFILVSRYSELRIRHKNLADLSAMQSTESLMVERQQGQQFVSVPASELVVGNVIRVKAGQTVAADGVVHSGNASVDESLLNGEFSPLLKQKGDRVLAGSVVADQVLQIEVTALGKDTQRSVIERIVQQASQQKAQVVALADRYANLFLAFVLVVAVCAAIVWWLIDASRVFDVVLAILIAACPCALSIATPSAIAKTTLALRQKGVLLRDVEILFRLADVNHWLFDKTGSLTTVEPKIDAVQLVCADCSEQHVREIASALEANSSHVLAKAFQIPTELVAYDFTHQAGSGVEASIGGEAYRLGNLAYIRAWHSAFDYPQNNDDIVLVLASEHTVLAVFSLREQLRAGTSGVVKRLVDLGANVQILSGDAQPRVDTISHSLAIEGLGELSITEKQAHIQAVQAKNHRCAMVGDGVNDTAALAQADVSIAVSSASDLAKSQADVALLKGDLRGINLLLALAKRCRRVVNQGFYWSISYNVIALSIAAIGVLTPFWAVVGMVTSSFIVLLNSRRIAETKASVMALRRDVPRIAREATA